ncbi:hypothetical protein ACB098_01G155900 [Castanea mollissima]
MCTKNRAPLMLLLLQSFVASHWPLGLCSKVWSDYNKSLMDRAQFVNVTFNFQAFKFR